MGVRKLCERGASGSLSSDAGVPGYVASLVAGGGAGAGIGLAAVAKQVADKVVQALGCPSVVVSLGAPSASAAPASLTLNR